jgi:hypothetical protein
MSIGVNHTGSSTSSSAISQKLLEQNEDIIAAIGIYRPIIIEINE